MRCHELVGSAVIATPWYLRWMPLALGLFGGSDFVMVFQAGFEFTVDVPRNDSHQGYSHLLMGERLGRLWRISKSSHGSH